MKIIAISIDDDTLARVDRFVSRKAASGLNRSRVVRDAVRDYIARVERAVESERESAIVHRHRGRLARQAQALVRAQAKP